MILVEGFKRETFPKIEIRREGAVSREPLVGTFPQIVAIASDRPADENEKLPVFKLDDIAGMADFIVSQTEVSRNDRQADRRLLRS